MKLHNKNIWFTSDTHYGHKNIVLGETEWRDSSGNKPINSVRNFEGSDDMNQTIINNINSLVGEDDYLFHLGDWSFGGVENIKKFRDSIKCKNIVLLLGNHDHHIRNNNENVKDLFLDVADYIELKVTNDHHTGSQKFVLCHYPIISWNKQYYGAKMLHGHQHKKGLDIITQDDRMDVGVDGTDGLKPYHLNEVVQKLKDYK